MMSISEIFHDSPVMATVITLAYAVIVGMFAYMMYRMYRR